MGVQSKPDKFQNFGLNWLDTFAPPWTLGKHGRYIAMLLQPALT